MSAWARSFRYRPLLAHVLRVKSLPKNCPVDFLGGAGMSFLFSFEGRVGRKYYWLFFVGLAFYAVLAAAISVALLYAYEKLLYVPRFHHTGVELNSRTPDLVVFVSFGLLMLAGGIAVLCVMVKRLHDRNRSATWLIAWIALALVTIFALNLLKEPFRNSITWDWWYVGTRYGWDLFVYGVTMVLGGIPAIAMFANGIYRNFSATEIVLAVPVLLPLALFGLWFFIEVGLRRGTVGPNKYGPDPLQ